jgi:hypothetical protein
MKEVVGAVARAVPREVSQGNVHLFGLKSDHGLCWITSLALLVTYRTEHGTEMFKEVLIYMLHCKVCCFPD